MNKVVVLFSFPSCQEFISCDFINLFWISSCLKSILSLFLYSLYQLQIKIKAKILPIVWDPNYHTFSHPNWTWLWCLAILVIIMQEGRWIILRWSLERMKICNTFVLWHSENFKISELFFWTLEKGRLWFRNTRNCLFFKAWDTAASWWLSKSLGNYKPHILNTTHHRRAQAVISLTLAEASSF